jgi:hypothetical protein
MGEVEDLANVEAPADEEEADTGDKLIEEFEQFTQGE